MFYLRSNLYLNTCLYVVPFSFLFCWGKGKKRLFRANHHHSEKCTLKHDSDSVMGKLSKTSLFPSLLLCERICINHTRNNNMKRKGKQKKYDSVYNNSFFGKRRKKERMT